NIWITVSPIARAALHTAWAASKVGAISLATFFTIANFGVGLYEVAAGHLKILGLLEIALGGAAVLVLSLLFSFVITIPVSFMVATCAYPFLHRLRTVDRIAFGMAGFLVGLLVWLGVRWDGPPGNLYFGSWISLFVVGGLAGYAGGLAFARHLP